MNRFLTFCNTSYHLSAVFDQKPSHLTDCPINQSTPLFLTLNLWHKPIEMEANILLVEDNEMMRSFLGRILSAEYRVYTAETAEEAQLRMEAGLRPDIIITDLKLPGINGREWLQQLKSSAEFADIPCMILSSSESVDERIKCLEIGAADFVIKPFHPRELSLRIAQQLKVIN
jgi:DNA-binding response OmpR family regulator